MKKYVINEANPGACAFLDRTARVQILGSCVLEQPRRLIVTFFTLVGKKGLVLSFGMTAFPLVDRMPNNLDPVLREGYAWHTHQTQFCREVGAVSYRKAREGATDVEDDAGLGAGPQACAIWR